VNNGVKGFGNSREVAGVKSRGKGGVSGVASRYSLQGLRRGWALVSTDIGYQTAPSTN